MQRFEVFDLDDLDISSATFDEDEEKALNALPHDKSGMKELVSYLKCIDSPSGWRFLFENYSSFMSKDEYSRYRGLALEVAEELAEFIDDEM